MTRREQALRHLVAEARRLMAELDPDYEDNAFASGVKPAELLSEASDRVLKTARITAGFPLDEE